MTSYAIGNAQAPINEPKRKPDYELCTECNGSGKDTDGWDCSACDGEGVIDIY